MVIKIDLGPIALHLKTLTKIGLLYWATYELK